jgi:hypothetical protein
MAKREQFTQPLRCTCGAKGSAIYEENENPMHAGGHLDTELIGVKGAFERTPKGFKCRKCGEVHG